MKLEIVKYRKALALSSIPVRGVYRYKNLFQILPADADAPRPPAVIGHHPFVIEHCFTVDETPRELPGGGEAPQWLNDQYSANKVMQEILLLLTAFSNSLSITYSNKQSWFIPLGIEDNKPDQTGIKVQWGQEGYFYRQFDPNIEKLSDTDIESVALINPNEFFNRYGRRTDQQYDLPNNITELLDAYFSLGDEDRHYFLSACSLFSQGVIVWSEHPSLSFAALVSSIETLIAADHKGKKTNRCSECGQEQYRVISKFREFFGKYGSPSPEFRKYALKVYQYRSKILHRGELFLGEVTPRRFGSMDGIEDDHLRRSIIRTCRICFVNWLLNKRDT